MATITARRTTPILKVGERKINPKHTTQVSGRV
jgi:hypothetical protein